MNQERLELIKSKLASLYVEFSDVNGTPAVVTDEKSVLEICGILKTDADISFEMLLDVLGVDNFKKEKRFEVVCSLYSIKFRDRIFVKITLNDSKNPEMPSLTALWKSADWYERETFDMFGINFTGHPDMRRIYMPEEFEHYPLRKDFPLLGIPDSIYLPKK
ncbi:MAG: NADH-quinone oxidoreductase subunit C [Ignavibacteriae bacterium]|nr:NADH-quinone oxidoreductase subunit C [Ignavibacteriota bacterium]